ncbi:MAG: serine hydrolase [Planctomycetes bacterium]|nr:serine hydrolase [Planctomycetota bacterium]
MPTRSCLASLTFLLSFGLAMPPATCAAQTPLTVDQAQAVVQRAYEAFGRPGLAVAIVQDGELLLEVALGQRAEGAPMTPGTLCNIASCTKAFTAAAIALLVQDGKLDWDDRVVDHVPEFRLADPWITAHMTVRDLLSHRCGLVTFAGDLLWYGSDHDDAEVLRRLERLPIRQRFREQFGYQNLMYLVAGRVVTQCSGMAWEDFVEQRLMGPLGMAASRACAQRLPPDAERAVPHIGGAAIQDHEFVACRPAASIYASVHDLVPWVRMLLAGGAWDGRPLLTEASLQQMWRPHVAISDAGAGAGNDDFRSYGMGWFVGLERGRKIVHHDGGMPGFLSKVVLVPADRFGFIVLNNANDGILNEALQRALLALRAGEDGLAVVDRLAQIAQRFHDRERNAVAQREARRQAGTQPSLAIAAYAGDYEDATYGAAVVRHDEQAGLTIELVPSRRRLHGSLSHWHHDTFRVDFPDRFLPFALVRFELDQDGAVAGFRIDCPIADFDFGALDFRRAAASTR